jgi:hypothetical protein
MRDINRSLSVFKKNARDALTLKHSGIFIRAAAR